MNPFGHIDLRVDDLRAAARFYGDLLPALGFVRSYPGERWLVWATDDDLPHAAYFAVTEDPGHVPNQSRVAFWAAGTADVDLIASVAERAGARIESGPRACPDYSRSYYAVFFQDPSGNRLEVYHRTD